MKLPETARFGVLLKWTLLGAGNQARAYSMFLFSADYDLSVCRKITDAKLSGQSDDAWGAYSLKIKMGCWKGKDAKDRK